MKSIKGYFGKSLRIGKWKCWFHWLLSAWWLLLRALSPTVTIWSILLMDARWTAVIPKPMLCTETTTTMDHFLPATTDFITTDPTSMVHTTWLLTTDSSPTWDLTARLPVLVLDVWCVTCILLDVACKWIPWTVTLVTNSMETNSLITNALVTNSMETNSLVTNALVTNIMAFPKTLCPAMANTNKFSQQKLVIQDKFWKSYFSLFLWFYLSQWSENKMR